MNISNTQNNKDLINKSTLTPYEMDIWLEESRVPHSHQFTIVLNAELPCEFIYSEIIQAIQEVLETETIYFKSIIGENNPKINIDLSMINTETVLFSSENELNKFFTQWIYRGWDLSIAPLINIAIGKLANRTLLMLRAHHIVLDGWSLTYLYQKIINRYQEIKQDIPIQFSLPHIDDKQQTEKIAVATTEIVNNIKHIKPILFSKSDNQLSIEPIYRRVFEIPENQVTENIKNGFTPFLIVSAAFAILLSHIYRSEKFIIGIPFLNRNEEEKNIINQKSNTLPLKIEIEPNHTPREIIYQIKEEIKFLKKREFVPLKNIISALSRTDISRQLFDTTVSYLHYPQLENIDLTAYPFYHVAHVHQQDAVAIHLQTYGDNNSVRGEIVLNSAAFDNKTQAKHFLDSFIRLVNNITSYLDSPISTIELVTERQILQLACFEKGPIVEYSHEQTIIALFSQKANLYPDNIAIYDAKGNTLTYAQLDKWSNTIALDLATRNIGRGDIIGVLMTRSPEMIAAIFAILKTGAAYLPIDSEYPDERIQYMLEDSGAKLVISNLTLLMKPEDPRWLDFHTLAICAQDNTEYSIKAQSTDPAYIIYTSGSTGKPKGVIVQHHSIINRLEWMQSKYPLTQQDIILHKTPTSFDVSVWELFWWSITGAAVVLLKPGGQRDPREIIQAIAAYKVTVIHFVPSLFEAYIQLLKENYQLLLFTQSLKYLFTSGEALLPIIVNQYRKLFNQNISPPRLINLYGPTEATVDVTYYEVDLQQQKEIEIIPIGYPINNTVIGIFSPHGIKQPLGFAGELQISGVQLAQGYLNQPELTADCFVTEKHNNRRWYKTGDLALWDENGALIYLGRIDGQITIRGNRIELDEIKKTLLNIPNIINTEILIDDNPQRGKSLIAVYVSKQIVNKHDLYTQLRQSLPEFMIPSRFIQLDTLPLMPNGKFDRKTALNNVRKIRMDLSLSQLTEMEILVANIWQKIVGQQAINIDDDFYSIGGDSILMLKLRSELESQQFNISLSELSINTKLHSLANLLQSKSRTTVKQNKTLLPFELINNQDKQSISKNFQDAYPISQLQLGLLYHSRETEKSKKYKDVFCYTLKMKWYAKAFSTALKQLIHQHPALRTVFNISDYQQPLQLIKKQQPIDDVLSIILTTKQNNQLLITQHMAKWSSYPYNLNQGPLFHVSVFIEDKSDFINLLLSFHHAILDGGSVANLIRELLLSYANNYADNPNLKLDYLGYVNNALPNPAIFIKNELNALGDKQNRQYWQDYLQGAENTLPIGLVDYRRFEETALFSISQLIKPQLVQVLEKLAKERSIPIKLVYLAAHAIVLAAISKTTEIITGVVTHTRPEIKHAEYLLGLFLNTVPLRIKIENITSLVLLDELFQNEKESHQYRLYPLSQIQKENSTIKLQTAFNYIHFHLLQDIADKTEIKIVKFTPQEETNFAVLTNVMRSIIDGQYYLRVDMDGNTYTRDQGEVFCLLFQQALAHIAYQPQALISLNQPITTNEPTDKTPMPFVSLITRLKETVTRQPNAIAVIDNNKEWEYRQLWSASEGITSFLFNGGVKAQEIIGIAHSRSFEQIVAIIAILRINAICLPIDLSYPKTRIKHMLNIAVPKIVLVEPDINLPREIFPATTIVLNLELSFRDREKSGVDDAVISANDIAYMLFTSGSTGIPKGVTMPHKGLANLINWQNSADNQTPQLSTLQYSPLSFDVSFQEIFSTLTAGATLHLISETERRDPIALIRYVEKQGIARLFLPYIALQQLAETAVMLQLFPKKLTVMVSSGEQLRITDEIRQLMKQLPAARLENHYGPTETHVVTCHCLSGDPDLFPALSPIGQPIAGVTILLLDSELNCVPDGVAGEICVCGNALASGYYQLTEEMQQKFVPHSNVNGKVIYRTGDIGIRTTQGEIIYLGRNDTQIKIRGYRIEPYEIELKIRQFFALQGNQQIDVAVIAKYRSQQDAYLIAYLADKTPLNNNKLTALRDYLTEELPAYMVPTQISWLTAFPKTPTGKRDDAKLRQRDIQPISIANDGKPKNNIEKQLCQFVAEILHINQDTLSTKQPLFDYGATSLTAMRLVVMVEKFYGVNVPLSTFVKAPTIAKLSLFIQQSEPQHFDPLVALRRDGQKIPLFLVHPMGGNILSYMRMLPYLPLDQPLYALQASGVEKGTNPISNIEAQAHYYIEALKRVQPTGPYLIGGWSYGGFVAFEMARQLIQAKESVAQLFILDTMALGTYSQAKTSDDALLNWFFWELLWSTQGSALPIKKVPNTLNTLQARFDYLTDYAVSCGALPEGSQNALLQRLFEVYRAHWQAAIRYHQQTQIPSMDITLIRAKRPLPPILREMHDSLHSEYHDPLNGWASKTTGNIRLREVDGDHLTMMEAPHVEMLVSTLINEINAEKKDN